MSLEKIQLPGQLIADLYRNSLIEGQETSVTKKKLVSSGEKRFYKTLGSNQSNILVLVNWPGDYFLADEHLQFLIKMLTACRLNLGDVAIVNHATQPVEFSALKNQLNPAINLLFGVEPSSVGLPLNFTPYKPQNYDGCIHLYTSSLDEISRETEKGKLLKSKLWVCLRKLFNV